jgi:hypothetical protein
MMVATLPAYAVVQGGAIMIDTISQTARGAQAKWLMFHSGAYDDLEYMAFERLCMATEFAKFPEASVVAVTIAAGAVQ